ncbi:septum formation initiator family protein [Actinobacteria bacterium YIM 96077]|uniref:Septum formation initiator family protein n=1 Tax=Phytoactinopolyspora halophila TaxID=1981511 RepID=A0A329QXD1_9ACTN|nr:septum formation initiator family protein [Phytoactinopolyspora halophila]AYY12838.1 septum formation initiator family protein [Actinobacteria bacterium YIM 96077]RAW16369.1 septum formation initiator family protein [Phytoactinopolyspora halophila]
MSAERALNPEVLRARQRRAQAPLRVLPGVTRSRRTPFVVTVLLVLGVGLVGLLLLNTALQQGSFALSKLEAETTALRDRAEMLSSELANLESPAALAEQARDLGMVPAEDVEFIRIDSVASGGEAAANGGRDG